MLSWFDPFLHSMEETGSLVVQVMVADWPTVRGLSRPVIVTPDVGYQEKRSREIDIHRQTKRQTNRQTDRPTCIINTHIQNRTEVRDTNMHISEPNSPIATTSIESDPRSFVTVQVYVPATL